MASRGEAWQPRELRREKSTSLRARRKHTERFPATCARFYDRLLRNVFLYVFGIYVDRKSEILPGVSPGIVKGDGHGFVGFIRALFNATEAQGSLSPSPLHLPTKAREGKIVVLLLTSCVRYTQRSSYYRVRDRTQGFRGTGSQEQVAKANLPTTGGLTLWWKPQCKRPGSARGIRGF